MAVKAENHDNRGDDSHPYGFVYFTDGKRCSYAKGVGEFKGVSGGTGGWEAISMTHIAEAQRYLTEKFGEDWYKS